MSFLAVCVCVCTEGGGVVGGGGGFADVFNFFQLTTINNNAPPLRLFKNSKSPTARCVCVCAHSQGEGKVHGEHLMTIIIE